MPNDNTKTPPFSVLIADTEAELKQYLQVVQFVGTSKNLVLHEEVEQRIKNVVDTLKILRRLHRDGWQVTAEPDCSNYFYIHTNRNSKVAINNRLIRMGLVGDIAELSPYAKKVWYGNCSEHPQSKGVIQLNLPRYFVWVRAKYLPLPESTQKLTKVRLNDGNTAWLTPQTLGKIRKLLSQAQQ